MKHCYIVVRLHKAESLGNLRWLIIGISYLVMLLSNSGLLRYLPIPLFFSVGLFFNGDSILLFFPFMAFTYPSVNAVVLLLLLLLQGTLQGEIKIPFSHSMFFVASISLWTIFASCFAFNKQNAFNECVTWIYICMLCVSCYNLKQDAVESTLSGLLFSWTLIAVLQICGNFCSGLSALLLDSESVRIPDVNSSALSYAVMILIAEYLAHKRKISHLAGNFIQLIFFVAVLYLDSRGIMLLLSMYIIAKLLFLGKLNASGILRRALTSLILLTAVLIFISCPVFERTVQSIRSVTDMKNFSNNTRLILYRDVLTQMVPEHFWIGVGPGNFMDEYSYYASGTNARLHLHHAHSIYLQMLAESGIMGMVLLISMLIKDISRNMKYLFSKKVSYERLCAYTCAFYMVYGLVENVWGDSRIFSLYFIINCLFDVREKRNPYAGIDVYYE